MSFFTKLRSRWNHRKYSTEERMLREAFEVIGAHNVFKGMRSFYTTTMGTPFTSENDFVACVYGEPGELLTQTRHAQWGTRLGNRDPGCLITRDFLEIKDTPDLSGYDALVLVDGMQQYDPELVHRVGITWLSEKEGIGRCFG